MFKTIISFHQAYTSYFWRVHKCRKRIFPKGKYRFQGSESSIPKTKMGPSQLTVHFALSLIQGDLHGWDKFYEPNLGYGLYSLYLKEKWRCFPIQKNYIVIFYPDFWFWGINIIGLATLPKILPIHHDHPVYYVRLAINNFCREASHFTGYCSY